MRILLFLLMLATGTAHAGSCTVRITAPGQGGRMAALYRYDDLLTRRTVLLVPLRMDEKGQAVLVASVTGRVRALLRIGETVTDLYLVEGVTYTLEFPVPSATQARSIAGTMRVRPLFIGLDPLDVNALTSDLNERLDAFLAEDLATDQQAGMEAARKAREDAATKKDPGTPAVLLTTVTSYTARLDTFERKLRKFYADISDAFFLHELDYGLAGLRIGPQTSDKALWERWVKGRPIHYDSPEQLRFLRALFDRHLMLHPFRSNEQQLLRQVSNAQRDSLGALLAKHDFLRDDARLRELVLIDGLYTEYPGTTFDRIGVLKLLREVETSPAFPEHRTIAANMVWDLTSMRPGSDLPMLVLRDVQGERVELNDLLEDAVCLAVTAAWCTTCAQEIEALKKLDKEYGAQVRFVVVSIDSTCRDFLSLARSYDGRSWTWLHAGDDPIFMDRLRLRNVPAFFLLNGRTLAQAPAPPPSTGMAEILHRLKMEAERNRQIKVGSDAPAPMRPER